MANNLTPKEEFLLNPVTEHNITDAAIATFETNLRHGVKVEIPFAPVQEGTGDPSPDNVRPISGWTGVNISKAGKNLVDLNESNITRISAAFPSDFVCENGEYSGTVPAGRDYAIVGYNILLHSGTYRISFDYINGGGNTAWKGVLLVPVTAPSWYFTDKMQTALSSSSGHISKSITITEDHKLVLTLNCFGNLSSQAKNIISNLQIETGTTESAYAVASDITTIQISWKHTEGTYEFSPIQEGSGDPSPENVRPIHPGLTITRDDNTELTVYGGSITFNDDGTSSILSDRIIYEVTGNEYFEVYNNTKVRFYSYQGTVGNFDITESNQALSNMFIGGSGWNPNDGTFSIRRSDSIGYVTFHSENYLGVDASLARAKASELYNNGTPIVVLGKTINPITYDLSITETQRAIEALGDKVTTTIYGGTVTVNEDGSADVLSDYVYEDLKKTYNVYRITNGQNGVKYAVRDPIPADIECKLSAGQLPLAPSQEKFTHGVIANPYSSQSDSRAIVFSSVIRVTWPGLTTIEDFTTYVQSQDAIGIVYPLKTPKTYHFPNVGKLKAFLGTNNIWSDIGNVNVKYLTQNSETGMEYRGDRALELRRRAMIADAPTIHTTTGSEETGGLASFKSYIKAPVKKIEIPFGPKQDLHGYDHPWPAGGGENKWNPDTTEYEAWDTTNYMIDSDYIPVPAGTSTIALGYAQLPSGRMQYLTFVLYDDNKNIIQTINRNNTTYTVLDITGISNVSYVIGKCRSWQMGFQYAYLAFNKTGNTFNFEPYSNECPISGWTGCEILRTEKNLFDVNREYGVLDPSTPGADSPRTFGFSKYYCGFRNIGTYYPTYGNFITIENGTVKFLESQSVYGVGFPLKLKAGINYRLSFVVNGGSSTVSITFYDSYGVYMGWAWAATTTGDGIRNVEGVFTVPEGTKTCMLGFQTHKADTTFYNIQIEISSTATDYEPYQGTTLPIAFTDPITGDPLTIYGGTVTLNEDGSADVVSDKILLGSATLSSFNWTLYSTSSAHGFYFDYNIGLVPSIASAGYIHASNVLKYLYAGVGANANSFRVAGESTNPRIWIFTDTAISTVADFKNWLTVNNCELLLQTTNLVGTYHFSNLEQLKIWLGENNFWCDISDDITVKYWNRGLGN